MDRKTRIFWYGDTPSCSSGFAQVNRNLVMNAYNSGKYEIYYFGINELGLPNEYQKYFPIYPSKFNSNDPYGREELKRQLSAMDFDIFFSLTDTFISIDFAEHLRKLRNGGKKFRWISYFPIDSEVRRTWMYSPLISDFPVCYTNYAYNECTKKMPELKDKLRVVNHGCNTKDFFKIDDKELIEKTKKEIFGDRIDNDTFMWINLNRNQPRKDIPRTIKMFAEFKKHAPNSVLLLFMNYFDVGGNLATIPQNYGLKVNKDVFFPTYPQESNHGFPIDVLNMAYNSSNAGISTTLGGGWELFNTECMATETPLLAPRNTANIEIIGDNNKDGDRGYFIECGTTSSEWMVIPAGMDEPERPLCNVEDGVKKMLHIYNNYEEAKEKAKKAKEWVSELTWDKIWRDKWEGLFEEAVLSIGDKEMTKNGETAYQTAKLKDYANK